MAKLIRFYLTVLHPVLKATISSSGARERYPMQLTDREAIAPPKRYTLEEYLALEEQAEFKSEFHDGEVVPMAGGSFNHNTLALNIAAFLKYALRGKGYKLFSGDVKVWIAKYQKMTYPDVMAIAGEPIPYNNRTDTLTNPCLIVEILSQSTEAYDRTDKFRLYRALDSLQEYVMVDQYSLEVQHYIKTDQGFWQYRVYESLEDVIAFGSIDIEMGLGEIYEGISWDA